MGQAGSHACIEANESGLPVWIWVPSEEKGGDLRMAQGRSESGQKGQCVIKANLSGKGE